MIVVVWVPPLVALVTGLIYLFWVPSPPEWKSNLKLLIGYIFLAAMIVFMGQFRDHTTQFGSQPTRESR